MAPAPDPIRLALEAAERRNLVLQAQLEEAQGLLTAIPEAILILDAVGNRITWASQGAARLFGHPLPWFIGRSLLELAAPDRNDLPALAEGLQAVQRGETRQLPFTGHSAQAGPLGCEIRLYASHHQGEAVVVALIREASAQNRAAQSRDAAFRIAEAALAARELPTLYRSVHGILRTLMPAENCFFALHDERTGLIRWDYWVDQQDPRPEPRPFGRGGLTEYILRTGRPQLLSEVDIAHLAGQGAAQAQGSESLAWMGVPLRDEQRVFGVLAIQSYEGGYSYQPEDLELLSFVSAQVAMAIDRMASEERLRLVSAAVEGARDSLFWINEAGGFESVNAAACRDLGYTREELLALSVPDVDPSVTPESWARLWEALVRGDTATLLTTQRRKDGSVRPVEVSRTLLTFQGRTLLFSSARDISERQAAEQALRASEEKFSRAFQASPDAININALDGTYLEVNEAFVRMSGWTRDETLGRTTLDLGLWAHAEDRDRMRALLQKDGSFVGLEAEFRMKDGSRRHGLVSGTLIQFQGETRLLSITRDITEWKAAEAAIRRSEDKFSRAFHASPDAIVLTRLSDGVYLDVSEGFEKLSGWPRSEAIGRSALELSIWADPKDRERAVELIRHQGEYTGLEVRFRRRDGSLLTGLMSGRTMEVDGQPCLLSVTRDISDWKAAEATLRSTEQRLRTVLSNSQAVIYQLDPQGRFLLSEGLGLANLGLRPGQVVGQNALEVYRDDLVTVRQIQQALAGIRSRQTTEAAGRTFDNFLSPVFDEEGRVESVIGIATDVTEHRQMEAALLQSQKLESLGILAGGIAHDFNNLLTVVMGNLNLAQLQIPEEHRVAPFLANIAATVRRATELTKQMLAYSGRGHFVVRPQDLNETIRDVTQLLEVSIPKKVRFQLDLAPELLAIQADPAQVQQVVMNLVTNAAEAIGDQEGVIRLATSAVSFQEHDLPQVAWGEPLTPGAYVLLEVSDTGHGIAPEVLGRIFDPFFTTKDSGRGLGLSAMLGILRGHRAGLRILSEVGRGSTFQVWFPATEDPAPRTIDPEAPVELMLRGRVLLVDDEPAIREAIGSALGAFGLEVETAQDGQEAVERFLAMDPKPDLVLMDVTMPRMNGREAFQRMNELDPSVPVVLCSGFTEQDSIRTLSGRAPSAFLQKPFQLQDLRQTLQRLLGA